MAKKKTQGQRKMGPREIKQFTTERLDTVKLLLECGKQKEALVYCFHILGRIIFEKFEFNKPASATVKEFFTEFVKRYNLPPDNVFPYVNMFEQAVYSHHHFSEGSFNEYMLRWANLYRDIAGDMPPAF